jgi:hypothetical protein
LQISIDFNCLQSFIMSNIEPVNSCNLLRQSISKFGFNLSIITFRHSFVNPLVFKSIAYTKLPRTRVLILVHELMSSDKYRPLAFIKSLNSRISSEYLEEYNSLFIERSEMKFSLYLFFCCLILNPKNILPLIYYFFLLKVNRLSTVFALKSILFMKFLYLPQKSFLMRRLMIPMWANKFYDCN